jgi:hypothetical protein
MDITIPVDPRATQLAGKFHVHMGARGQLVVYLPASKEWMRHTTARRFTGWDGSERATSKYWIS